MEDHRDGDVSMLVHRARQGDQDAWDALVHRFTRLLWSIARSWRLDQAQAGDVVQATWLAFLEHLDDIRDPAQVGAWLATTARRESQRSSRHSTREVVYPYEQPERIEDAGPLVVAEKGRAHD